MGANSSQQDSRGERLARTLVELSDTLLTTFDIDDYLLLLCQRTQDLLDVDAVGVMLEAPDGTLGLSAGTSRSAAALDVFEIQTRQGPCFDAYRTGERITNIDLVEAADSWPEFAPRALDLGFRMVCAFPMRLRSARIGAMNLFQRTPGRFDDDDLWAAKALADIATIGILSEREHDASQTLGSQLQRALDSRVVIEQAKGIIAERRNIDPDEAFELLRRHARTHQRTLRAVAREVVDDLVLRDEL